MCAEFVGPLERQGRDLQTIKPRLRIVLCVYNVQENREACRMWNALCNPFLECKKHETGWHSSTLWGVWRTDDSPFRHFPCIFHKFHVHFFTKLCQINFVFRNCVHTGCWSCLWDNTKWNGRPVLWPFWHDVLMLHDNACPHAAAATQDLITTFGWEQSPPPKPRLSAKRFSCVPASENFPWWPAVPWQQGQRSH
jgi:hypothetical protein